MLCHGHLKYFILVRRPRWERWLRMKEIILLRLLFLKLIYQSRIHFYASTFAREEAAIFAVIIRVCFHFLSEGSARPTSAAREEERSGSKRSGLQLEMCRGCWNL